MTNGQPLCLYHEILLLSLHDQDGTDVTRQYQFALSGAMIAELVLANRISIEDSDEQLVHVIDNSPLDNELLDHCLASISQSDQPQSLTSWILANAHERDLKSLVANELCQLNILSRDEENVLWTFSKSLYPELDPKPERKIKSRLETLLFRDGPEPDERTLILASLADGANLLEHNLGVLRVNKNRGRIHELEEKEKIGNAVALVRRAIRQNQEMFKLVETLSTIHND